MSRLEFSAKTKAQAFMRAAGQCEGMVDGQRCAAKLDVARFHYDHVIADGLRKDNSLGNCACLCTSCHSTKTPTDVRAIAKAKRIERKHNGIRKRSTFPCSRDSRWRKKINGTVVPR